MNSQSCVIEAYFANSKVHNYSRKLFIKLLPKILPKICSPKLVPEAAPEQLSTTPKLVPNIIPKNIPEINSPKLSKIVIKNLRRGNTKGSCLTGDAGDHSIRKPTCDRALFCWHQALALSIKTSCASKSSLWQNHLEVYYLTHTSCGEKNTVSISTNLKVAFAVPMDARTCHFHRTVRDGANGCRKIRIANRIMMMKIMMIIMMRMMTMMLLMRDCEGVAAWRDAKGMWREFTWGGAWNWTFRAERRYLDPKRKYPHDVHDCTSLSPFLNSHLEVYIVRHTYRAGEKKYGQY